MGQRVAFFIGVGTTYGNLPDGVDVQRQQSTGILQQNDGLAGCLQGDGFVFFFFHFTVGTGKVCLIGSIEQADEELYPEDIAHTVVDDFFTQPAFFYQFAEGKDEGVGRTECTAYVQSGLHALTDGLFHVFGGAVLGVEVFYGITVGYYIAAEAHFTAQAGGEPVVTALNGNAVVVVVRTHYAQQSGFPDDPSEGIDMYVFHFSR